MFKKKNRIIIAFVATFVIALGSYAYTIILPSSSNSITQEYTPNLPYNYANKISQASISSSGYTAFIIDTLHTKELVIVKQYPSFDDKEADFTVTGTYTDPVTQSEKEWNTKISTFGVVNQQNKIPYGVFRLALPQVNFSTLNIEKLKYRSSKDTWETSLSTENEFVSKELLIPNSIGEDGKPSVYLPYFSKLAETVGINSLPYNYFVDQDSLKVTTLKIEKYAVNNNKEVVEIKDYDLFWSSFSNPEVQINNSIVNEFNSDGEIVKTLESYQQGKLSFSDAFDVEKVSNTELVLSMFPGTSKGSFYLLYNKETSKIEPLISPLRVRGGILTNGQKSNISEKEFLEYHTQNIDRFTKLDFQEFSNTVNKEQVLINAYNIEEVFDYAILNINKDILKNSLYTPVITQIQFLDINAKELNVKIRNTTNYDYDVVGLSYKKKKRITTLDNGISIKNGTEKQITIPLPRSFENLFVHKKTKETGFKYPKDIYDLRVLLKYPEIDSIFYAPIRAVSQKNEYNKGVYRKHKDVVNSKSIRVNDAQKRIIIHDSLVLNYPLVTPKNYTVEINQGTYLNIVKGGKIIINGPLQIQGSKENPVTVTSTDGNGQGIFIWAEGRSSKITYANFSNLSYPIQDNWQVTGAITFYESPVSLNHVKISDNKSEDALNIVRTTFSMENCTITNTQSDAFDGDFVKGIIKNSTFNNLGNDAIDVSGSNLKIEDVLVSNAGDKGLSAGEDSKMHLKNVTITESEIGVAGKDLSIVDGNTVILKNNKLGFTAFKKKPEFGPSHISLTGVKQINIETSHLIENKSSLTIDGKRAETIKNVKNKMYGVEFGRSSKETNKKQ